MAVRPLELPQQASNFENQGEVPASDQIRVSTQGISRFMQYALDKHRQHIETFDDALVALISEHLKSSVLENGSSNRFKIDSLELSNNNETVDVHLTLHPDIDELQSDILGSINPIADKNGFVVDRIEVTASRQPINVKLQLSVIDALGLDRHARLLLSDAKKAGLSPSMLGKRIRVPRRTNDPKSIACDIVITGLVELNPENYLVRVMDLENAKAMQASPRIVRELYYRFTTG